MAKTTAEPYERWRRRLLSDNLAGLQQEYNAMKSEISLSPCKAFLANTALNRYNNVPLIDETRVILNDGLAGDYIHASRVDGYNKNSFILTQAPIDKSPIDYWRMVWQERVQVCVCLTVMKEDNVEKSAQFFPTSTDKPYRAGPFRVFLLTTEEIKAPRRLVVCRLTLHCWFAPGNRRNRSVFFIIYGEWPDRGVPESPAKFAKILEGVKRLQSDAWRNWRSEIDQDKARPMTDPPPLLINCSAGVGRSATFAACIAEADRLRDTQHVDLAATVRRMRRQRVGSIQNVMQYLFVARALAEVWRRMSLEDGGDERTTRAAPDGKSIMVDD